MLAKEQIAIPKLPEICLRLIPLLTRKPKITESLQDLPWSNGHIHHIFFHSFELRVLPIPQYWINFFGVFHDAVKKAEGPYQSIHSSAMY